MSGPLDHVSVDADEFRHELTTHFDAIAAMARCAERSMNRDAADAMSEGDVRVVLSCIEERAEAMRAYLKEHLS